MDTRLTDDGDTYMSIYLIVMDAIPYDITSERLQIVAFSNCALVEGLSKVLLPLYHIGTLHISLSYDHSTINASQQSQQVLFAIMRR